MDIHTARPDQAAAIHALMRDAFAPYAHLYTPACLDATVLDAARIRARMAEGPVFVAEREGRLLGTISAVTDGNGVYARGLGVDPQAQGQGIGRRLLDAVENYARATGARRMWLSTTTFLDASTALYAKCGLTPTDGPTDLHGTTLISFEKRL